MLGIPDPWVASAYLLCIAGTLVCVVYGLATWNRGGEEDSNPEEDKTWAEHEDQMEQEL